jgi:hypothetical protein
VDYERLHAVIEDLVGGPSGSAGDRIAAVVLAQANALTWVRVDFEWLAGRHSRPPGEKR